MAAGLGFKDFVTGEVLTAADVDGYLMQGIWVFTNATARDAAVTSPQEGNFAFTKDNNSLWYYDGAAWVASGATGDIEGVTAGIGISGGGTSGTVTVTNSMATAIDAKGDLVAGTGADTFAKLTVGANDTVLTADSTTATGLKWAAAAASGSLTLLSTTTCSGTSTTVSSISQSYKHLFIEIYGVAWDTNESSVAFNTNLTSALSWYNIKASGGTAYNAPATDVSPINDSVQNVKRDGSNNYWNVIFYNYTSTTDYKAWQMYGCYEGHDVANRPVRLINLSGGINVDTAVDSFTFKQSTSSTMTAGTIKVYGVN